MLLAATFVTFVLIENDISGTDMSLLLISWGKTKQNTTPSQKLTKCQAE